jgi:hypothetical protein
MTVRTWQLWSTALRPWTGTWNLTVVPCYPYLHRLLTCPCRSGSHMFDTIYRVNTCTGTESLCLTGLSWKHLVLCWGCGVVSLVIDIIFATLDARMTTHNTTKISEATQTHTHTHVPITTQHTHTHTPSCTYTALRVHYTAAY